VENGIAQGSGRSIEAFHLLEALEGMRELFIRFGGHAHAAGLTLPAESLDTFRQRLQQWAAQKLTPDDLCPVVEVDAVIELSEVNDELWQALCQIGPFGMDNERPLFAIRGAQLSGPPQVWKEKHLKLAIRQGGRTMILKGFGKGELAPQLCGADRIDVAFELERDWNGGFGLIARECRACEAAAH
jgi:single-stranded-DNA-specific exonuclease